MTGPIQSPIKGQPMRASWGAAVSSAVNSLLPMGSDGLLARQGVAGTGFAAQPANLRDRRATAPLHPWKVFAVGKSATVDHCFEIYVPDEVLHIGEHEFAIEGLTQVEAKENHYTLDCEDEISGSAVIYLAVVQDEGSSAGSSPSDDNGQQNWKARIISTLESIEDAKEILAILPIAKLSIDDSGEYSVGKVVAQYAHSSITLTESGADPDKVSIDKNGGEDDENKLQIAHFNDTEKDSGKGLDRRLKADPETGVITAQDSEGLMLVARKDGQVIYVPLSGSGKDPEPPEPGPGKGCDDHPGGGDAVDVTKEKKDDTHGGGYGGDGVPADSEGDTPGSGSASCCY